MKKIKVCVVWFVLVAPSIASAQTVSLVEVPITQEAIADDPALANATTFDLMVDSMGEEMLTAQVSIFVSGGVQLYNHPFESPGDAPPPQQLVDLFPSVAYDTSYLNWNAGRASVFRGSLSVILSTLDIIGPAPTGPHNGSILRLTLLSPNGGDHLCVAGDVFFGSDSDNIHSTSFEDLLPATGDGLCESLVADFDDDFDVDLDDFNLLAAEFGTDPGFPGAIGDFNGDQDVDIHDFTGFLANFGFGGPMPPPGNVGDADGDMDVDLDDFTLTASSYGVGVYVADADGDEDVDLEDFNLLAASFGFDASTEVTTALPEPAVGCWLIGLVSLNAWHRAHR